MCVYVNGISLSFFFFILFSRKCCWLMSLYSYKQSVCLLLEQKHKEREKERERAKKAEWVKNVRLSVCAYERERERAKELVFYFSTTHTRVHLAAAAAAANVLESACISVLPSSFFALFLSILSSFTHFKARDKEEEIEDG